MPIELRPSDVAEAAAGAFTRWGETFRQIFATEYEKERVREVNSGLVTLEETWQKQLEDYPTRGFEISPEVVEGKLPSGTVAPQIKSLGQLQASDVLKDFHKSVKAQEENINRTVRNKRAREEMLAHLAAGAVQQQARLLGLWRKAAQSAALAGLQDLSATVMANKTYNADMKVAMIKDRTDSMLASGWISADEATRYLAIEQEKARYIDAHNGAMAAMRIGGAEAGEKWLQDNTPWWEANPEARAKVLQYVRGEWEYQGKVQDAQYDRVFSDLHIQADTPEAVDLALAKLQQVQFFNGDQKYVWEQRFQALKANLEAARKIKPASLEDFYKQNEDDLMGRLAINKGRLPLGTLRKMVEDAYYGRDKDGTGIPRIRGAFVRTAFDYLNTKDDPAFIAGNKIIDDKTSGLDIKEKSEAQRLFLEWSKKNPNADEKTITQAAINIAKPVVERNLDAWFRRSLAVIKGEERVKDELEMLTEDIEAGKYIGLTRPEYLARYGAALVKRVQSEYPQENIASFYIDETGEVSGTANSAILVSAANRAYLYKLKGKTLILWGRLQKREGKYEWELIGKPGQAKAEEELRIEEKKRSEREAFEVRAKERARLEAESKAKAEAEKVPGIVPGMVLP